MPCFARSTVGLWLLSAFVLSVSWGGELRAFILKPEYSSPIDSVHDVLDSGLPYTMVLFGGEIEQHLMERPERHYQELWKGKTVVDYQECPYERVSTVQLDPS